MRCHWLLKPLWNFSINLFCNLDNGATIHNNKSKDFTETSSLGLVASLKVQIEFEKCCFCWCWWKNILKMDYCMDWDNWWLLGWFNQHTSRKPVGNQRWKNVSFCKSIISTSRKYIGSRKMWCRKTTLSAYVKQVSVMLWEHLNYYNDTTTMDGKGTTRRVNESRFV